jgi:hypothetical protein
MSDTHPSVESRFHEMIMSRSPEERLRMGCSMFDTAKEIVRSSIRERNPNLSEREMRKEIFLRFYGNDFSPQQKEKILFFLNA